MKTFEFLKYSQLLLLISTLAIFSTSCKTKKLDIYEPYKDITVVYGLLNPADSIQYIKINKAFLGEGDANIFAQEPDSINYNPADLKVTLNAYQQNQTTLSYEFKETIRLRDTVIPVTDNNGIFTKKNNIVWYTNNKVYGNFYKYKLIIKNIKSSKEITGETKMINLGDAGLQYFTINIRGFSNSNLFFFDNAGKSKSITADILAGENANLYNLKMKINYIEYTAQDASDSGEWKSFDYNFEQIKSDASSISLKLDGSSLLSYFKTKRTTIFSDKEKNRKMRDVNFTLFVGSKDYTNYVEINAPRASYLLDKPVYTNVTNGYGLFANRYSTSTKNFRFDVNTLKALRDSLGLNIKL